MIGFLIDVDNDKAHLVELDDKNRLDQLHKLIGCRCIDIAVRTIGDSRYNIVLDDEGLLVDNPTVSAIDKNMHVMLVGNLVVFGMDGDMELADIDRDDAKNIRSQMYEVIDIDEMKVHPVVVMSY